MVFCKLLKKNDGNGVYSFGDTVTNMSGEIVFYNGEPGFAVKKQPDNSYVARNWIIKLYAKYSADFRNSVFREKLSYQCG